MRLDTGVDLDTGEFGLESVKKISTTSVYWDSFLVNTYITLTNNWPNDQYKSLSKRKKPWSESNSFTFILNDRGGTLGGVCPTVIVADHFGGGGLW